MRNERERLDIAVADLGRLDEGDQDESQCLLVKTFAESSYPTAAGSYFACHPVGLSGTEGEGDVATQTEDTSETVYAFNLGSTVPDAGTVLIAHAVGGRWVFRYDA